MTTPDLKLLAREILLGFWKVHILHHAAEEPVVGQWVLTELRRHGYDISPGTLYPLLKRMERNGWLRCHTESGAGPRGRRYYHLTSSGAAILETLREAVVELHHEVIEESRKTPRKQERMPPFALRTASGRARLASKGRGAVRGTGGRSTRKKNRKS
jgi:DNA-binding PadR family transcriptional regulator